MTTLTINKWGNSKGLRLKNDLLTSLGWTNAKEVRAEITEDKKLIISLSPTEDDGSLAFLFRDYEDDGIREELLDFGEPVGEEAW